jgi:transposase
VSSSTSACWSITASACSTPAWRGNSTLQWNLHDLWPELTLPGGASFSKKWTSKIARRLARAEQTMRVRIARDELRRVRELTRTINALETEIADLVARVAPQLVAAGP